MGDLNIFHKDSAYDSRRYSQFLSSDLNEQIKCRQSWIKHQLAHNEELQMIIDETDERVIEYKEDIKRFKRELRNQ